jgi:hypothetical protein
MLTIKVIRPDGTKSTDNNLSSVDFSEFVEEVNSVFLNTGHQSATGSQSVTYFKPGSDRAYDVYEGVIYVMNENGKTIAKYDLGYGNPWNYTENKANIALLAANEI